MNDLSQQLKKRIADNTDLLSGMAENEAARKPAPTRWSKKEILGHLVDSVANNHQRIVRTALSHDGLVQTPGYEQEAWVELQRYQHIDWRSLVALWSAYNTHLANVIGGLPPRAESGRCQIGSDDPIPLRGLIEDYLSHMDYHLAQLADASR